MHTGGYNDFRANYMHVLLKDNGQWDGQIDNGQNELKWHTIRHSPFDILGGGGGLGYFGKKIPCSDFEKKKKNLLNGTVKKIICLQ